MKKLLLSGAILLASFTNLHAQWTPQTSNITPGYYSPFLDVVTDSIVWAIVSDPTSQQNPVAEFTKTVDGGNLWIDGPISNAANLAPSCIFGLNADTAWAAMWNVTQGAGKILQTTDGGATWNQQTTALFTAAGNFPDWVYFWDGNNGVCLGDPTSGYFEIYTTTNGGNNWVRTADVDIAPELPGEFGITDVFREFGDNTLYFGTNLGRIYKTIDRGLHWTAAQTPFNDFIGAIAFKDANNGLCVSGGATGSTDVAYTTDGGATWNLKGTNTGMSLVLGLCYVPGTTATYFLSTPAGGSVDGTTFTPNDATNWIPVDNLIHTDIEFINDSIGWTGSNELDAPMMKWQSPIIAPTADASSKGILSCPNSGNFVQHPKAIFFNNGLDTATFDVTMTITGGYSSTKTITNLPFFVSQTVIFDPWTPATTGAFTITVYTSLTGDSDHSNDTIQKNVTVFDGFENYGWTSKPDVGAGTFGLAGAFNLNGNTTSSPGTYYSIGGADFAAVQPTANAFATDVNTWSAVASMPTGKYQFSAQKSGGNIYCAGGYLGGFTPDPLNYVYSLSTGTWSSGPPMPTPLGDYASGVYMDTLIYYIGGFDGAADQNTVQIFNTVSNTWTTATDKPGTPVSGLRGSINGNTIIVAGGFSQLLFAEVADAYIGIIDAVDPTIITWTALPAYPGGPVGRLAAGTVFRNLKPLVLFVGGDPVGTTGADVLCDCWAYDISQSQWLAGEGKPTPVNNVSDFAGLVYNDSLWMASTAGYTGTALNTTQEWLNLGPSPTAGFCGTDFTIVNPCTGSCNGSLSAIPVNGVSPFTYVWSTADTTTSIDSLCVGTYSITITDSIGCTATTQVTLNPPVPTAASSNVLCNGACNGTASITYQGGLSPFTYLWSNSSTTDSIGNLCPGTYSVIVLDNNSCFDSTSVTITEPTAITSIFTGIDVLCNGQCNGSFLANVLGGIPPYSYATCTGQSLIPGTLCPATYCVQVTDFNGCTTSGNTFVVNEPAPLAFTTTTQDPTCFSCTNGYIVVTPSGGTSPYTITWLPANGNLSNDSILNLDDGIYTVTVTDANGCSHSYADTLINPVGIQDYNAAGNDLISLYPNPATDQLIISIKDNADVATLSMTDVSGRIVKTTFVINGQKMIRLNLANLEAGVYFVNVLKKDGNNGGYVKFVKE